MGSRPLIVRLLLEVVYLLVGFAFLRYFYAGMTSCDASAITHYVLRMTGIIGCLDVAAGVLAFLVSRAAKEENFRFLPMLLAAGFVALLLGSYLYWMSDASGVLRFGQVACSMEEGYEVGLIFLVAPFFTLLTMVREFAVMRLVRR